MQLGLKAAVTSILVLASVTPSFALSWICHAPEIDASVGSSALAVLASAGLIAYNRLKA